MILERVLSGGQTGADQAGWRAAQAAGLVTGGWMPKGWLTEEGPRPEFAERYGAWEHHLVGYPPRTKANVRDSEGTLWFGNSRSRGGLVTIEACRDHRKPYQIVEPGDRPSAVADWLRARPIQVLNVAGNRESSAPGIGARVEAFLAQVFALLREG